jgi:PPP family 3-phenylpropionic acid transporter
MYGAFGVASPFMPRFFESRGVSPQQLGLLFGLGTAVRLLSGPFAGRVADLLGALRTVLATCTIASACAAVGLLPAHGFPLLLAIGLVQAAVLAPTTTLADALALAAATPRDPRRRGFEYGWVRGAASAAFVAGSLVAGQVLSHAPLTAIIWIHAALLAAAGCAVGMVPPLDACAKEPTAEEQSPVGGVRELLRIPLFRRVVLVAALVLSSHAMHDAFAMVRWNAAGITPAAGSVLWSESVAAEVLVFFLLGPALLDRIGPAGAMALAALAGVLRWSVVACTTTLVALALVQPLHGFTFALLHLACMRLVAATVPAHLAATAQAIYAVGAASSSALLTVASGWLYARFGAQAFLVMAMLCAAALPLTRGLRAEQAA